MTICECGKKYIAKAHYEKHRATVHVEAKVEPVVEPKVEPVVEVKPEPIIPVSQDITLKFSKPVEVRINGKAYFGKEVVVQDIQLASEIVRLAREAHGDEIFGY